jgi:hypothetical protein
MPPINIEIRMPDEEEKDSHIREFVSLLRVSLAEDYDPGASDMWERVYGLVHVEGVNEVDAMAKLIQLMVNRILASGIVAAQMAQFIAEMRDQPVLEILDRTEAWITRERPEK